MHNPIGARRPESISMTVSAQIRKKTDHTVSNILHIIKGWGYECCLLFSHFHFWNLNRNHTHTHNTKVKPNSSLWLPFGAAALWQNPGLCNAGRPDTKAREKRNPAPADTCTIPSFHSCPRPNLCGIHYYFSSAKAQNERAWGFKTMFTKDF